MIVIALWVPYFTTQGIGMRQFMELQAVFALGILFSIAFLCLLLPLVLRETALTMQQASP